MRAVMEQAYGCKIYEEYSTVENAILPVSVSMDVYMSVRCGNHGNPAT
jgi:hypothetical protein